MTAYYVVFEPTGTGFSAYVPDLPGCIAAGDDMDETRALIREAIEAHVVSMRQAGEAVPRPSLVERVEVGVA
ncbi:MAG: type II toxin-antitoxin system HicB family antitoxin [Dehalococcoidia bacterium]